MSERRALRSGEALSGLGLFVPRGALIEPGCAVRVWGPAIERGHIEPCAISARPFGAQPPPWERAGWERSLAAHGASEHEASLRAMHTRERGAWVALRGIALRPGRAELSIALGAHALEIRAAFAVDVRVEGPARERSLRWFRGEGAWRECVLAAENTVQIAIERGQIAPRDALSIRAVDHARPIERWASRTIGRPTGARQRREPHAMRAIRERGCTGRYATIEWRSSATTEPGTHAASPWENAEDAGVFALSASRRRDAQGEWAVELRGVAERAAHEGHPMDRTARSRGD